MGNNITKIYLWRGGSGLKFGIFRPITFPRSRKFCVVTRIRILLFQLWGVGMLDKLHILRRIVEDLIKINRESLPISSGIFSESLTFELSNDVFGSYFSLF